MQIQDLDGCVAHWCLGKSLTAVNDPQLTLEVRGEGPGEVGEGAVSDQSMVFTGNTWLEIPRSRLGPLNLKGKGSAVSVVAWVQWRQANLYQAVGGIWNETQGKRQYCLFLNINTRYDSEQNLHGHVSHTGGATPGADYCITYATGANRVPLHKWVLLAMTYDSRHIRVYLDGRLDANPKPNLLLPESGTLNPFHYEGAIFDGGREGADFTIGAVHRSGEMGNWFYGYIDTFSVFNRALSEDELRRIREASPQGLS